ncbi:MAG: tetratricopeptide (TPR) repeat protein [Crocinitomix sp.]|jgi:tetratricopeptide (TPR) repeat protein
MDFSAEHIELFDAYLQDGLSTEERSSFEERLINEPAFKTEFEAFQGFEKDLVDAEVIAFKEQLKQWDKAPIEKATKQGRIIPIRFIALAASILIILLVSVLYFVGQPNNQDLLAANFEPYDNILTVRGEKEDIDEGMRHYEKKEYSAAITLFENYPKNASAQFYKGEAHLAVNEYDAAINSFQLVITSDGIFKEIAEYHLALAYLGKDAVQKSKEALSEIQKESDYYSNAQELLVELE